MTDINTSIFTKEKSKIMYGVAIGLMCYLHLFKSPGVLDPQMVSVFDIAHIDFLSSEKVAWFGKICVAIYSFISGYGVCIGTSRNWEDGDIKNYFFASYNYILKHIFKFYIKYWIVFLSFETIFALIGGRMNFLSIKSFLLNFIGLKFDCNGAWWYVRNYVFMMMVYPIAAVMYKIFPLPERCKERIFIVGLLEFVVLYYMSDHILISKITNSTTVIYLLLFMLGAMCYKHKYFDIIEMVVRSKVIGLILILLASLAIRFLLADSASYNIIDIIIIIPFIYSCSELISKTKIFKKLTCILGYYSTYIWLIHCFFFNEKFKCVIIFSHFTVSTWFSLILISVLVSILLDIIYKSIIGCDKLSFIRQGLSETDRQVTK